MNRLYYGDNLSILRNYIDDESVDLVYIDPPFNSNRAYNVIFNEADGSEPEAQIQAFNDTWHWNESTEDAYNDLIQTAPHQLVEAVKSFRLFLGEMDLMAYLVNMAIRLVELHRVLKPTGSFYLHCDPTASHYLKIILDQIFEIKNFRNEVVWCYAIGGRVSKSAYGKRHDVLLFYTKSEDNVFNWEDILQPWSEEGEAKFKHKDNKGKYRLMGRFLKDSPIKGHRDVSPEWEKTHPDLVYRHYMKEGRMCLDYWNISPINQASKERLGYPTQKPEALLERIIQAGSNEGDTVLDAFCGCGTAISVAQKLKRQWIGIDVTYLAISLIEYRLGDTFKNKNGNKNENNEKPKYEVRGEPKDEASAKALAQHDRYQFQWWALSLVRARPFNGKKKGADGGVDGVRYFQDVDIDSKSQKKRNITQTIVVQVKSGKVSVKDIRELKSVVENQKAAIGVFITLQPPTKPMVTEAVTAGAFRRFEDFQGDYHKIQICTIKELLNGGGIKYPQTMIDLTFRKAERHEDEEQLEFLGRNQRILPSEVSPAA